MILLKNDEEYKLMKKAGLILAETMNFIGSMITPGISAQKLDSEAYDFIRKNGAEPAFLGFDGYKYTTCISINNEVIHGLPIKSKILHQGDIVSIDIGCSYKGYFADMAKTFPVGEIDEKRKLLIEVTEKSLIMGINSIKVGLHIGIIGHTIQTFVQENGFSVVKSFVGHGIGLKLHEEPQIPNFGKSENGPLLKRGMAIAIEPMVNSGSDEVISLPDGWTVVTKDGSDSAHFEHTVFVRDNFVEILTLATWGFTEIWKIKTF